MIQKALATILLAATSTAALAEQGFWSSGGPYGGNVFRLQVDHSVSGRMYAIANGGVFRKGASNQPWVKMEEGLLATPYLSGPLVIDRDGNENLFVFDDVGRLYRSETFTDPYAPPGSQTRVVWRPTGFTLDYDLTPVELVETQGASNTLYLAVNDVFPDSPTGHTMLLRSTDAGATFTPVTQLPVDIGVTAIAIDPANPNHVLAGLAEYELPMVQPAQPMIWESTDGGASFHSVFAGNPMASYQFNPGVNDLAFTPGGRVFALVNYEFWVSIANGAASTWNVTNVNLFNPTYAAYSGAQRTCAREDYFVAMPSDGSVIYTIGTGVTKWQLGPTGGAPPWTLTPTASNSELTANPSLAGVNAANLGVPLPAQVCALAPSTTNYSTTGFLYAATNGAGLFRTTSNLNDTWTRFSSGSDINQGLGGVNIRAVTFHPTATQNLFAGLGDNFYGSPGIFGSSNSATSWFESNIGLKASNVRHIAFDPTTTGSVGTSVVYAAGRTASLGTSTRYSDPGYRSAGIFKSVDGGSNWTSLNGNLPSGSSANLQYLRNMRWISLDPRSCGAPPFQNSGAVCASGVPGGLKRFYATADGFLTTNASDPGFPGMTVQSYSHRIVRTDDGGTTYVDLSAPASGFPASYMAFGETTTLQRTVTAYLVMIDPADSQRLFAPTFSSLLDPDGPGGYSVDVETGMFFSSDGGATWQTRNGSGANQLPIKSGFSLARHDILSAVMHPFNGNVMWVTTYETDPNTFELLDGGVFRTTDGGLNWQEVSTGLPSRVDLRALILDPEDPQLATGNPDVLTLYAASAGRVTSPGAVYRSDDGGLNWRSISVGLPAASATALAVDPTDRRRVLAGTDFGVWEITQLTDSDGDGIPNGTENQDGGDGNGDGQQDSAQRDVGTIIVSIRSPTGGTLGTTSDVIENLSIPTIAGGCQQTEDVQSIPSINFGQDLTGSGVRRYFYPRNLWRIQINDCSRAIVDITYHGADFVNEYGWSFRYFGPEVPGDDNTVAWHAFQSRAHLVTPTVNKWRLTLDANQYGSYRSDTDRILFVGGPACFDDRLMQDGFETTNTAKPACGE